MTVHYSERTPEAEIVSIQETLSNWSIRIYSKRPDQPALIGYKSVEKYLKHSVRTIRTDYYRSIYRA